MTRSQEYETTGSRRSRVDPLFVVAAAACMVIGPVLLFSAVGGLVAAAEPLWHLDHRWILPALLAGGLLPGVGLLLVRGRAGTPVIGLLVLLLVGFLTGGLLYSLTPGWQDGAPLDHWPEVRETLEEEIDGLRWPPFDSEGG
jgi:hypothetical protein